MLGVNYTDRLSLVDEVGPGEGIVGHTKRWESRVVEMMSLFLSDFHNSFKIYTDALILLNKYNIPKTRNSRMLVRNNKQKARMRNETVNTKGPVF